MNPLIFIGAVLAVAGLAASGNKKKPAGDTSQGDATASPDNVESPAECGKAEAVENNAPNGEEKKQELQSMLLAHKPPEFDDIDPEDVKRLYAENPQAVNDPMADIAVEVSRFCEKKGESTKADAWWRYSEYLRRPPKGGK